MRLGSNESRRIKSIRIEPELIIAVLNWCRNPGGTFLSLPKSSEIPDGAEIISVWPDTESRSIKAHVYHETFDIVEPGCYPPMVNDYMCGCRTFRRNHEPTDTMIEC